MDPSIATPLADAYAKIAHPRSDYRTDEGKKVREYLTPALEPYISNNTDTLDLGCGMGGFTLLAENLGGRVTGIDCAESAIRFARNVAEELGSSARFDVGDFSTLPYEDESFDLVIFPNNIIMCSYDEFDKIVHEVHRVLRPKGVFVMTMRDNVRLLYSRGLGAALPWGMASGRKEGTINIPNEGSFSHPTYFWTCGFAVHIASKRLALIELSEWEKDRQALVFRK